MKEASPGLKISREIIICLRQGSLFLFDSKL